MKSTYAPKPRVQNPYLLDGKSLVAKVPHMNGDYLPDSLHKALDLLGGLEKTIHSGDTVMIKPNFNCSYRTPLSTDLGILSALIEILQDAGAKVSVGELSGRADWPTEKVVQNLGVLPVLKRYNVPFIDFQYDEWITIDLPGTLWGRLNVPRQIYESEKRVYLSNMRCHSSARYSGSLKLSVGFISAEDREIMHSDKDRTERMIAENNLVWQPDLVVMDGRRSTVAWHGRGAYVYPNVIMASGDMVALDTEAVRILKEYPEKNRIQVPWEEIGQITHAHSLGLGNMNYHVVSCPAHERTEEEGNLDPAARAVAESSGLA